jgi:hypothetical protein
LVSCFVAFLFLSTILFFIAFKPDLKMRIWPAEKRQPHPRQDV